jgi:hypothetical protein
MALFGSFFAVLIVFSKAIRQGDLFFIQLQLSDMELFMLPVKNNIK